VFLVSFLLSIYCSVAVCQLITIHDDDDDEKELDIVAKHMSTDEVMGAGKLGSITYMELTKPQNLTRGRRMHFETPNFVKRNFNMSVL